VRREIEDTREDLGETIEEIGDRVDPRQVVRRGKDRVRRRVEDVKEKVMGSADPHRVEEQIEGNPLAAGLIAFGAGALIASLLPADRTSREAAQKLAEEAKPAAEQAKAELKEAGREVGEHVSQSAKESAHHLQERAKQSADEVKQEAKASGEHLKEEARRDTHRQA
jgi:gas vesicle protein